MKRLTRRQIVAATLGTAAVVSPAAAQAQGTGGEKLESAREQVRKSIREMEEVELPMSAEPAFLFQP